MVSRVDTSKPRARPASAGFGAHLFLAWRHLLTTIGNGVGSGLRGAAAWTVRALRAPWRLARHSFPVATAMVGDCARALSSPGHAVAESGGAGLRRLMVSGILAVALGAFGAAIHGLVQNASGRDIVLDIGAIAGWAFVRLLLLRWTAPEDLPRSRVDAAWGAGALPWVVAVTPGLQVAAFAASAVQTYRATAGAGADRARAGLMTSIAFGAQIVLVGVSWILAAGVLVLLSGVGS